MSDLLSVADTKFLFHHRFKSGHSVPVYEALSIHGLNQLLGYAKFINRDYGEVLYRGECRLHDSLVPSLMRGRMNASKCLENLKNLTLAIDNDEGFRKFLKLESKPSEENTAKIESMLQHYGVPTRYIDLVDNHWVALWMSSNSATKVKAIEEYVKYESRLNTHYGIGFQNYHKEEIGGGWKPNYGYILLVCLPSDTTLTGIGGVYASDSFIKVDLRQALPSNFLRPHAQHGLLARRRGDDNSDATFYDMSKQVIGVVCGRVDRISSWLGNGELLSQSSMFPPPCYDAGYDLLLSRANFFSELGVSIVKYA